MRKPSISPSKISMFIRCPKEFSSQYIEKLPPIPEYIELLIKGKLTHRALEIIAHQPVHDIHQAVLQAISTLDRFGPSMVPTPHIINQSEQSIKEWYTPQKFEGIIAVEENFTIEEEDLIWNGVKDKKQLQNGILRITDYKTGGRLYSTEELQNDPQIIIYAFSEMHLHPNQPVEVVIDMVEQQRETQPVSFTPTEINEKMDYLRAIAHEMYSRESYPPQTGNHCSYCSHPCPAFHQWMETLPDLTTAPESVQGVDTLLLLYKEISDKIKIMEGRKNQLKDYILGNMAKHGLLNFKGDHHSVTITNRTERIYNHQILLRILPPTVLSEVLSIDTRKLDKLMPNLPSDLKTQITASIKLRETSPYIIVR